MRFIKRITPAAAVSCILFAPLVGVPVQASKQMVTSKIISKYEVVAMLPGTVDMSQFTVKNPVLRAEDDSYGPVDHYGIGARHGVLSLKGFINQKQDFFGMLIDNKKPLRRVAPLLFAFRLSMSVSSS